MARILSVWSPRWAMDVWKRRSARQGEPLPFPPAGREGGSARSDETGGSANGNPPTAFGGPPSRQAGEKEIAALVLADRGVRKLYAVSAAASDLGLYPGQKAADAGALVPELTVADADPAADAQACSSTLRGWRTCGAARPS